MTQGTPPPGDVPPASGVGVALRPSRPAAVTAAVAAMAAVAVVSLVNAVVTVVSWDAVRDAALKDATTNQDASAQAENVARAFANAGVAVGLVVSLLLAAGFVVLALFNLQGNNATRITTWVVCGLALCCGLGGLATSVGVLGDYPGWLRGWVIGSAVVDSLLYVGIIVLLALPVSNAFFKPRT